MSEAELLASGIADMGLDISTETQQTLLNYIALLQKWNKVYNLTAVREPEKMVILHLLDSLSALPYVESGNLLDVGSGAGLPGIVLAIVRPDLNVTTIDTVQKKTIFMRQVKGMLGLTNLEVVHGRVEQFKPDSLFSQIISRAFSEIELFLALTQHLIAPKGKWLAMKGVASAEELKQLSKPTTQLIRLNVAHLEAQRHLVIIENRA